ncbi:hypothetical protein NDU88_004898 [Pleurodeles waltl]|uniref:Uncharacterized protein n=1 Tax=Pleurodeles waltl TaxID=8319 RepID=A0AAV7WVN7_PLEWA|nr:hypothetical protein NDU88_004898 [Pleurodeles waltl]
MLRMRSSYAVLALHSSKSEGEGKQSRSSRISCDRELSLFFCLPSSPLCWSPVVSKLFCASAHSWSLKAPPSTKHRVTPLFPSLRASRASEDAKAPTSGGPGRQSSSHRGGTLTSGSGASPHLESAGGNIAFQEAPFGGPQGPIQTDAGGPGAPLFCRRLLFP